MQYQQVCDELEYMPEPKGQNELFLLAAQQFAHYQASCASNHVHSCQLFAHKMRFWAVL